jgi:hypothetical protein
MMRLGQPFWLQQLRNNPETPSSVFLLACALGEHRKMSLRKAFLAGSSLEEEPRPREDYSWPGVAWISKFTQLTNKEVSQAVAWLESAGYMRLEHTVWVLMVPAWQRERADHMGESLRQSLARKAAADRRRIVRNTNGTVSPGAWATSEDFLRERSPEQIAAETRLCNLMDADAPADVINDAIAYLGVYS